VRLTTRRTPKKSESTTSKEKVGLLKGYLNARHSSTIAALYAKKSSWKHHVVTTSMWCRLFPEVFCVSFVTEVWGCLRTDQIYAKRQQSTWRNIMPFESKAQQKFAYANPEKFGGKKGQL
jgi:hypothetical protein